MIDYEQRTPPNCYQTKPPKLHHFRVWSTIHRFTLPIYHSLTHRGFSPQPRYARQPARPVDSGLAPATLPALAGRTALPGLARSALGARPRSAVSGRPRSAVRGRARSAASGRRAEPPSCDIRSGASETAVRAERTEPTRRARSAAVLGVAAAEPAPDRGVPSPEC
jgi:hypothetical protein